MMNRIRVRFALVFMVLTLVTSGLILIVSFDLNTRFSTFLNVYRLRELVNIASSELNGDLHATFRDPSQASAESYQSLLSELANFRAASPAILSISTLRNENSRFYYVFSTSKDPDQVLLLGAEMVDIGAEELDILARLSGVEIDSRIKTGPTGRFITGYAPIYTTEGQRDGILKIAYSVDDVRTNQFRLLLWPLVFSATLLILSGFLGWQLGGGYYSRLQVLRENIDQLLDAGVASRPITNPEEMVSLSDALLRIKKRIGAKIDFKRQNEEAAHLNEALRIKYYKLTLKASAHIYALARNNSFYQQIVEVIKDVFSFYYVGLYLVDSSGCAADFIAGTGKAGEIYKERGERILVGEGAVGWALQNGKSIKLPEGELKGGLMQIPELPLARSEIVTPLVSGSVVKGALVILSENRDEFTPVVVEILDFLTELIAAAMESREVYGNLQSEIELLKDSLRRISTQEWDGHLTRQSIMGFVADEHGVAPILRNELSQKLDFPKENIQTTGHVLEAPIKIRGQILGMLRARKSNEVNGEDNRWTEDEIRFIKDIVDSMAVTLDNARLYNVAQQSSERDRILAEITAQVRSSTDVNTILQTAVVKISQALQVPQDAVVIHPLRHKSQQTEEQEG
jgi:GAF domain-containing protein